MSAPPLGEKNDRVVLEPRTASASHRVGIMRAAVDGKAVRVAFFTDAQAAAMRERLNATLSNP